MPPDDKIVGRVSVLRNPPGVLHTTGFFEECLAARLAGYDANNRV
jgi:hypothetical protein